MVSKTNEIEYLEETDTSWFDTEDLEQFKGSPKWWKTYNSLIYGCISCGFLILASFKVWQGMSFIMFIAFFVATILSIVIDSGTFFR
ncbi:MAG: hypothetical protein ACTSQF_05445 [Candidatus Heimdallarchaeaceae archaeon]